MRAAARSRRKCWRRQCANIAPILESRLTETQTAFRWPTAPRGFITAMNCCMSLRRTGFQRAAVGDRDVLEKLRERNWPLGGEGSGHIVSLDHHTTGDGIISALLVLAALKRSG